MPQPMTTQRAWAGRLMVLWGGAGRSPAEGSSLHLPTRGEVPGAARRRGRSFRYVRRADFLRQLVPTHAVTDLGPHLPLHALRLRFDRVPHLVEPAGHRGAVDIELLERVPQLADVDLQRPVEAPVLRREARDVRGVYALVRVGLHGMVEDQRGDVDEVLLVDLVDLQLAEQQVR